MLYRFDYGVIADHCTIIDAKNDRQALRKFKRETRQCCLPPSIISIVKYEIPIIQTKTG